MSNEVKAPVKEAPVAPKAEGKKSGKVILKTTDGCIAVINGENVSFYGKKYLDYEVGKVYEF